MSIRLKKLLKWSLIILIIIGIGYVGFKVYHIAVEHFTQKVGEGVAQGVSQGIGDTLNPLKLPGKIFGK
jgi:hypothetical protein